MKNKYGKTVWDLWWC